MTMRIPVAREAVPFAAVLFVAALAVGVWRIWAAALPLVLLLFCLWFFRDPERTAPADPLAVLAPADGRILKAGPTRISIFMNLFSVHVCRMPMAGRLASIVHSPGRFLAAFRDEASDSNERLTFQVRGDRADFRFTLVAGVVARRIVSWVGEGEKLRAGQRVGLIRFGSRVDVDLPPGCDIAVRTGVRVLAGETIIARLGASGDAARD